MFECLRYPTTYVINNNGAMVQAWENNAWVPGNMHYFLDNGNLMRCADPETSSTFLAGGDGGVIQEFDWNGALVWEFVYNDAMVRHHHDIAPMPNGNVLILAWELMTGAEAIANGRDPALLDDGEIWPEHIVEVEPVGATGGNIVWEWHLKDHLIQDFDSTKANWGVIADHPELLDINAVNDGRDDWIHANAIDYNPDLDQIVMSSPFLREFYIIDHGTTTEQAAGHTGGARGMGGDILYRWGNPQHYDRGTADDQRLFNQHDVHWIEPGLPGAGNILLFNNGVNRPGGNHSTIEEIVTTADANGDYPVPAPGVPHGPAAPLWTYTDTPAGDFYSSFISSAQRLPNGNTLVDEGATGTFFEIDANTEADVWLYVSPVNASGPMTQGDPATGNPVFRVRRYPPDHPGFVGRDLTPIGPVQIDPATGILAGVEPRPFELGPSYPNPFRPATTIAFSLNEAAAVRLEVYDVRGAHVETLVDRNLTAGAHRVPWVAGGRPSGVYFYSLQVGDEKATRKMALLR
jgi:hypothetical protein